MKAINLIPCFVLCCVLSACAAPLKSQEMLPQYDFYDQLGAKTFQDAVSIRNVDVAKGVGGVSPVTPEEYRAALVSAFRQADLYGKEDSAKYALDAFISEMNQPVFGFNMTATTTANYKVFRNSDNELVYEDTLALPCTKTISDAFDGALRIRMASGCSVGENITHLIKVLSEK